MHPANRAFYANIRLSRYQAAGVREIWLIDYERETEAVSLLRAEAWADCL